MSTDALPQDDGGNLTDGVGLHQNLNASRKNEAQHVLETLFEDEYIRYETYMLCEETCVSHAVQFGYGAGLLPKMRAKSPPAQTHINFEHNSCCKIENCITYAAFEILRQCMKDIPECHGS